MLGALCGFVGARPAIRSGSVSQERVATDFYVSENCNYGNCEVLARNGAKWMKRPAIFAYLGGPTNGICGRVAPVLPRRIWRLTRRPSASVRAADKFLHHPPNQGRDGIFRFVKYYGTS